MCVAIVMTESKEGVKLDLINEREMFWRSLSCDRDNSQK